MKKTNLSDYSPSTVPNGAPWTIAVVAAEWNPEVTNAMLKGAVETLLLHGVKEDNIIVHRVPGTYELSYAADTLAELDSIDAVINAKETNYLYFCASDKMDGTHRFAATLAEHNRNAAAFHIALNKRGIK